VLAVVGLSHGTGRAVMVRLGVHNPPTCARWTSPTSSPTSRRIC